MLGLMFLVASCQPQADNNSADQGSDTQMMDSRRSQQMNNNGRSSTRARMNQQQAPKGSCGSDCGTCDPCGPCCDTGCGPCSDNDQIEETNDFVEELGSDQA